VAPEVKVDPDACMGSGNCTYEAPGVFELDDDSIAVVVDPAAAPADRVVAAARKCPARAITVLVDGQRTTDD
jgi:ferredoxin